MKNLIKRILRRILCIYRSHSLSPQAVTWAYRLFLDRNPESRATIKQKLSGPIMNVPDLRRDMMFSDEFARNNPDIAPFPLQTVVITELSCGMRMFVDLGDGGVSVPIVRGQYEQELVELLPKLVEPGMTALDVGANIGFFSLNMAPLLGDKGRIFAFEPVAELAALVRRSVEENRLQEIITVEGAAVGDQEGHADILCVHNARNQGASYLVEGDATECNTSHETRKIPMITLDTYDLPAGIGFIKIDIEGAEPMCIRGAAKLLRRDRPIVMTEVHPVQLERVSHSTPNAYLKQFADLDYTCFALRDDGFVAVKPEAPVEEVITVIAIPSENSAAQDRLLGKA